MSYTDEDSDRSCSDTDSDSEDPGCLPGRCRLSADTLEELVRCHLEGNQIYTVEIKGGWFGHRKECADCGCMPEVGQLGANMNPHTKTWRGEAYTAFDRLCQPCLEDRVLWSVHDGGDCGSLSEEARDELKELLAKDSEAAKKAAAAAERKKRQEAATAATAAAVAAARAAATAAAAQQARKKSAASKKDGAKSLYATKVIKKVPSKR